MPPIWVHFALGVGACALAGRAARRTGDARVAWLGFGLAWGSVLPDVDLLVASVASAATGFDPGTGELIHRTVSHGLPLVVLTLAAAAATWLTHPRASRLLAGLGLGIGLLHILPDLFYLVETKALAPFTLHPYGPFGPIDQDRFTDTENNLITGADFLGESLVYAGVFLLARRLGTANRFTEALPWLAALNAAIYLPMLVWLAPRVSYDDFLVWTYSPGVFIVAVSTILVPWKGRATLLAIAGLGAAPSSPASTPPAAPPA